MPNILESATLDDIALYLQREEGLTSENAHKEALKVLHNFQDMKNQDIINGWYFNEFGQLELLPSEHALNVFNHSK